MSSRGYNCVKEGVEQYYNNDLVTVDIDDLWNYSSLQKP
jgi:hypothetical protein